MGRYAPMVILSAQECGGRPDGSEDNGKSAAREHSGGGYLRAGSGFYRNRAGGRELLDTTHVWFLLRCGGFSDFRYLAVSVTAARSTR